MIKIDAALLEELGLGSLSDNDKDDAVQAILDALEEQVGDRAIDLLSDEQVEQLESQMVSDDSDAEATMQWLQTNVPNYQDIVNEELSKIKETVKSQGLNALTPSNNDQS